MNITDQPYLTFDQKEMAFELWNYQYPVQLNYETVEDFEQYLKGLENLQHYLLLNSWQEIDAWAFTFFRDGEQWFALLIKGSIQRKGIGTLFLNYLKIETSELNGWVIDHNNDRKKNGNVYPSPLVFYQKNGFNVVEGVRLETDKLSAIKVKWKGKDKNFTIDLQAK
jgi:GNAT superfamily N-acetyltransferase